MPKVTNASLYLGLFVEQHNSEPRLLMVPSNRINYFKIAPCYKLSLFMANLAFTFSTYSNYFALKNFFLGTKMELDKIVIARCLDTFSQIQSSC